MTRSRLTRSCLHPTAEPAIPGRPFARAARSVSTPALAAVAFGATLALALSILTCAGTLARADGARAPARVLPPAEIPARLATRGYAVSEPVIRRGSAYLTHGRDRFGQRTRLVVDARNAEIIGLRVIDPPAGPARPAARIGRP